MVSIILTTHREGERLKKALESIGREIRKLREEAEVLVIAPDLESRQIVEKFKREKPYLSLNFLRDRAEGKPKALNLAFKKARGDILILTDGDVYVGQDSLQALLIKLKGKEVGAVSGRPLALNPKNNLFGFWAHSLVRAAHQMRQNKARKEEFFPCSGYLYALRKWHKQSSLSLPASLLAEDAYLSQLLWQKGKKIAYAEEAKVYVKYPDNLADWIKQKRRTLAGFLQLKSFFKREAGGGFQRTFVDELAGIGWMLSYPANLKEILWTFALFFVRLYVWFLIFWQVKIRGKSWKELWIRVESTK